MNPETVSPSFRYTSFNVPVVTQSLSRLTWNKMEIHQMDAGLIVWPRPFTLPMTLTLDFQDQILKSCISRRGGSIDMERKGCESLGCWTYYVTFSYDLGLGTFKFKFWNSHISGMGGLIDMDWKGCESDTNAVPTMQPWCLTTTMTWHWIFGFSRSTLKIGIDGLIDMKQKGTWIDWMMVSHPVWSYPWPWTLDFQGLILKITVWGITSGCYFSAWQKKFISGGGRHSWGDVRNVGIFAIGILGNLDVRDQIIPVQQLLASPGHQHPSYRLCRIGRFLSYMREDFNPLCPLIVEEWYKL